MKTNRVKWTELEHKHDEQKHFRHGSRCAEIAYIGQPTNRNLTGTPYTTKSPLGTNRMQEQTPLQIYSIV